MATASFIVFVQGGRYEKKEQMYLIYTMKQICIKNSSHNSQE